ncbi:TonB-dependent receptor [bacterium]|nr:TonB-dependent receptor [bacterium]
MNRIYFTSLFMLLSNSNFAYQEVSLSAVFALEEMVISASKKAEPIKEAPVPVTIISSDMIQRSGARNLRDLLAWYVPGMSIVADHNEFNISMRGVYASSQQKILIMLNGHRLNSRVYSEANVGYGIGLNKLEKIEVLRGPASSLYGNVALAAVVNLITKDPNNLTSHQIQISAGNHGSHKLSLLSPIFVKDSKTLLWAEVFESNGEKRFNPASKDYSATPLDATIYIDRVKDKPAYDIGINSDHGKFNFLLNMRNELSGATFSSVGSSPNYDVKAIGSFSGLHEGLSSKSLHSRVLYATDLSKTRRMNAEVYHNRNRVADSIILNPNTKLMAGLRWKERSFGMKSHFEIDYKNSENNGGTLSYGFEFDQMENYHSVLAIGLDPSQASMGHLLDIGKETIVSSYMQLKHKIGQSLIYNIGLRYDSKNRKEGPKVSNASPRIAMIYQPNDEMNYKLSYAESFVDAPYWYRYNVLSSYIGSRNLKPEYLKSIQFTPSYISPDKLQKYQINIFYNQLSDFVFRDTQAGPNGPNYRNAGQLDSIGYELEASFQIDDSQNLLFNYTHQRVLNAKDYGTTGSDIHNIPSNIINVMYNKDLISKSGQDIKFNLGLNWYGSQLSPIDANLGGKPYVNPQERVSSRLLVQTGIRLESHASNVKNISQRFVDFRVYNLLNEKYRQGGSPNVPYPQQSRTFMISVGCSF